MKNHCINLTSLGFAVVALVLHIVCMATPYYVTLDTPLLYFRFGLFMLCIDAKDMGPEDKSCEANGYQSEVWLKVSQAVSIIGVLLLAMGTLLLLFHVFTTSQGDRKRLLPPSIRTLCIIAAVFILFGDGLVFKQFFLPYDTDSLAVKEAREQSKFNWGFYLDIVAGVLALFAGVSQAVAISSSRSEESGIV